MKRALTIVIALAIAVAAVPAQAKAAAAAPSEPLMAPGDLALMGGVGYGLFWGALDFSAGAEFMLGQFAIAEVPITYGGAVKGSYYGYSYNADWGYSYAGAGVFGTLHLSYKDIPGLMDAAPFLANVDMYIGLGVGLFGYSYNYYNDPPENRFSPGLYSTGGVNYFLTPNFAINFEGGYYGYGSGGGLIGVLLKL